MLRWAAPPSSAAAVAAAQNRASWRLMVSRPITTPLRSQLTSSGVRRRIPDTASGLSVADRRVVVVVGGGSVLGLAGWGEQGARFVRSPVRINFGSKSHFVKLGAPLVPRQDARGVGLELAAARPAGVGGAERTAAEAEAN